ncbi:uncharacterized protein [Panulirus ornatus]|uniref:uncharacterized protein n=1 Tax=Panulirus ornatus TaxID=150431 RepID=UPI003A8C116C
MSAQNLKTYFECGPAPDYSKSRWIDDKFTLGIDFPNNVKEQQYFDALLKTIKQFSDFLGGTCFAGDSECSLPTTEVLAHYAAVTDPPYTQAGNTGNTPSWSMAAYLPLDLAYF